ncbi:MAG: hypothetical protein L0154_22245 [Chloroflexi bacterium]|nr:hypothetical protein [Chloroflexota bacterium]
MKRSIGIVLGVVVGVLALSAVVVYLFGQNIDTSDPSSETQTNPDLLAFPVIEGTNLLLNELTVPTDLNGKYKLIVVAYDDSQQPVVDEWLAPLEETNDHFPELAGYYVPLLPKSAADSALFIIGGMGLVAGNDEDRARTIVVFTDVDRFNELLDIEDKNSVRLFLLDDEDNIIWQTSGAYSPDAIEELEAALTDLTD